MRFYACLIALAAFSLAADLVPDWEAIVLPTEMFIKIFAHLVEGFGTRRFRKDPFRVHRMVNTRWRAALRSPEFWGFLRAHPKASLQLLKRSFSLESAADQNMLQVCRESIRMEMACRLVLTAQSVEALWHISRLPCLVKDPPITVGMYDARLHYGLAHGQLDPYLAAQLDTRPGARCLHAGIHVHFGRLPETVVLDLYRPVDLVRLALLEVMLFRHPFPPLYTFLERQVSRAYQQGRTELVQPFVREARSINLYRARGNLLLGILWYPLLLAAYVGDVKFIRFVDLDYDALALLPDSPERYLGEVCGQMQRGELEAFPTEGLLQVRGLLGLYSAEDGRMYMGTGRLGARSRSILEDGELSAAVHGTVRGHPAFDA